MFMKKCSKCNVKRELFEFSKSPKGKDGLSTRCKHCDKQYRLDNKEMISKNDKIWRENNKESISEKKKQWSKSNKELISIKKKKYQIDNKELISKRKKIYKENNRKEILEKAKLFRENNKEKVALQLKKWNELNKDKVRIYRKQYQVQRRQNDPLFKLICNTRNLICMSFKRGNNNFKKNKSTEDIIGCDIEYFRSYIELKFTEGMNLENYGKWHLDHIIPISIGKTEEEIIKLNHYTNFQPLWAIDNLKKSNKY